MGVVLYRMLTEELPFAGKYFKDQKRKILSGQFFIPYFLSLECKNLFKKLINT